jgi:uncharacterized protein (DUF2267 family)
MWTAMDFEAVLDHIFVRAALEGDRERATRALLATLGALIAHLEPYDAQDLRSELPPALLARLDAAGEVEPDVVRAIAAREPTTWGFAIEHAQAVGEALVLELRPELLTRLRRRLPPALAALLEPRPTSTAPPPHPTRAPVALGEGTTLATGRPGSRHPLSDSHPSAQHHSVASSDDPHGDTKLSSARGLTQERTGDTLATGRPGSHRPISES